MRPIHVALAALTVCALASTSRGIEIKDYAKLACCEYDSLPAIVWTGQDSLMTTTRLAAYCAPILWFSPDEPLISGLSSLEIRVPSAFPFEGIPERPVVYHRVRMVITRADAEGAPFTKREGVPGPDVLDLSKIAALDLDFFFYYPTEEGMGRHRHDVESVQMKILIGRRSECSECPYAIGVMRVVGKAHGIQWYDNTLAPDDQTHFPITILVEEGKHASCTDKNGDGYYTPSFDVNMRVNDAWGVRDVMRSGGLFAASFQSWMAKVRVAKDRVYPPLPEDAPPRRRNPGRAYAAGYMQYELRPFPPADSAAADPALVPFIASKGSVEPEIETGSEFNRLRDWVITDSFVKSVSAAARYDGELGLSVSFPLLIVKSVSDPLAGGWIVNRIYLKDTWRDIGYNVLYTPSASRWFDPYFSLGVERDKDEFGEKKTYFTAESGVKFRASVEHSMLKFMTKVADFWGLRAGLMYRDAFPVHDLSFVFELGAGTW